jgi:uncharacterized damage-inducible protein DinB
MPVVPETKEIIVPTLKDVAFADLERELSVTRKVLEHLPPDYYGWKPHEKSMTLGKLALHVSDLPQWACDSIAHDELDVSQAPRSPDKLTDRKELLARFDRAVAALRQAVADFDAADIDANWTLRNGEQVFVARPRWTVYRIWSLNHLIHHRAQLCLYLRLLNIPVPTVYFNTADDPTWVFE